MQPTDPVTSFLVAACVPPDSDHASGSLEPALQILNAHPDLAGRSIYAASVLGDDSKIRAFLQRDPAKATAQGGPHGWDALTHLCFSRFLRADANPSADFLRAAEALLEAGANANTGFYSRSFRPEGDFESVLYGAAGIAHHAGLTRLLLEHGADPNDGEVSYHTPETYDNGALKLLVQSGKLTEQSLATMLLRKADWHDLEGVEWLLEQGANPNAITSWGKTALHQAVVRDNSLEIIETMLKHGADPTIQGTQSNVVAPAAGLSSCSLAARRGRGDLLELFQRHGFTVQLQGLDRLLAACARDDSDQARSLARDEPTWIEELRRDGGKFLAFFAGNGNQAGIRQLLDLGVAIAAPFQEGDGYFCIAPRSTALHVAAWRAEHETVKLLLARGAQVNARDGAEHTPLQLAVLACVDSWWTHRRSPESVKALLEAGASKEGVRHPCGYDAVDALLAQHRT